MPGVDVAVADSGESLQVAPPTGRIVADQVIGRTREFVERHRDRARVPAGEREMLQSACAPECRVFLCRELPREASRRGLRG
jgi:hypothetical protein